MSSLTDSGEAAPTGTDAATESTEVVEPIQGPVLDAPLAATTVEAPRLARHQIELVRRAPRRGHRRGHAACPLVVVHGFSAEGFLYAQSLSRLVKMGFRVIAIDTAGHGATQGLPLSGQSLNDYADLLGRVIDELGIERFVVAGHSMGGQLITRMAAKRPDQVIGVVLIDAIVGDTWDRMVYLFRVAPPLLSAVGGLLHARLDHRGAGLQRSPPGRQAHPARRADPGGPRGAAVAAARPDADDPADPLEPLRPRRARPSRRAGVRAARLAGPGRAAPHRPRHRPAHRRGAGHDRARRALLAAARPRDAAGDRRRAARHRARRRASAGRCAPPGSASKYPTLERRRGGLLRRDAQVFALAPGGLRARSSSGGTVARSTAGTPSAERH